MADDDKNITVNVNNTEAKVPWWQTVLVVIGVILSVGLFIYNILSRSDIKLPDIFKRKPKPDPIPTPQPPANPDDPVVVVIVGYRKDGTPIHNTDPDAKDILNQIPMIILFLMLFIVPIKSYTATNYQDIYNNRYNYILTNVSDSNKTVLATRYKMLTSLLPTEAYSPTFNIHIKNGKTYSNIVINSNFSVKYDYGKYGHDEFIFPVAPVVTLEFTNDGTNDGMLVTTPQEITNHMYNAVSNYIYRDRLFYFGTALFYDYTTSKFLDFVLAGYNLNLPFVSFLKITPAIGFNLLEGMDLFINGLYYMNDFSFGISVRVIKINVGISIGLNI